jgi:hypothetical protein
MTRGILSSQDPTAGLNLAVFTVSSQSITIMDLLKFSGPLIYYGLYLVRATLGVCRTCITTMRWLQDSSLLREDLPAGGLEAP